MRVQAQGGGDAKAHDRHGEGVRKGGSRPMLHELFLGLHSIREEDIAAMKFNDGHVIGSRLFHILLFYCTRPAEKSQRQ